MWARRGLGTVLILLSLTPTYRVLDRPETGRPGSITLARAYANLEAAWWGLVVALVLGAALVFLVPPRRLRWVVARSAQALQALPVRGFAALVGGLATLAAMAVGQAAFFGFPTLVDEMAALLHGRILASGRLALPLPEPMAAWLVANTLVTEEGWASQYPLFHPLLLAGGFLVGAPWLVGPLSLGVAVAMGVLVAHQLFPDRPGLVRLAGVLLAGSPFLVFLGAGYLSHVPAAALTTLIVWACLKAREGGWGWGVVVGAAAGALVGTRPWTGVVMGVVFPTALWLIHRPSTGVPSGPCSSYRVSAGCRSRLPWLGGRLGAAVLGGLPFAVLWGYLHSRLFGSPTALGYTLAYGPSHNLGFHRDPWGNLYGPLEALGYTSADLILLGIYLLETAVPAVPLVALYLVAASRVPKGTGVLLTWALLPVLGNFFYWHHGFHLGPRMLYEAAPAWILLVALAVVELSAISDDGRQGEKPSRPRLAACPPPTQVPPRRRIPKPADWFLGAFLVSAASFPLLVAQRFDLHRLDSQTLARIEPPSVSAQVPTLVFVHGSWQERIAARLQALGMRLDSIEAGLRRNDVCLLHAYVVAREMGDTAALSRHLPQMDFRLLANTPPHLTRVRLTEGEEVWVDPSLVPQGDCLGEAHADRHGIVALAPLVWQGDLPGIEEGRAMFVRDLGPGKNLALLRAFPHRRPYLYAVPPEGGAPRLFPYEDEVRRLWGEAPPSPSVAPAGRTGGTSPPTPPPGGGDPESPGGEHTGPHPAAPPA